MGGGKHEDSKDGDDKPNTGRAGKAPKGDADKHPWPVRPPRGYGRPGAGPAGKGPPKVPRV